MTTRILSADAGGILATRLDKQAANGEVVGMTFWRSIQRYLVQSWAAFLVPFYYTQEAYHHGVQVLFVSRWGRSCWEVYSWGPNTGSDDLAFHFKPLPLGSPEYYHRLQLSADSGLVRRVGRYPTWLQAKAAM